MKRRIRFIVKAVKWRDKVNGNTYHSVRIMRVRDGKTIAPAVPYTYGYGRQYEETALAEMVRRKWIPPKYRQPAPSGGTYAYLFERENGYPIHWEVTTGTKREMIANGTVTD